MPAHRDTSRLVPMRVRFALAVVTLGGIAAMVFSVAPKASEPAKLDLTIDAPCRDATPIARHTAAIRLWYPKHEGRGTLPVLIYAPGWGSPVEANTTLLSSLARRGFVVIGIERQSPPDGSFDFSSAEASARTNLLGDQLVACGAREASLVLQAVLDAERRLLPASIAARIDRRKAGILGYSFGGAIAAEAARIDRRFRAAVNLDGWIFGESVRDNPHAPYMTILASMSPPSHEELTSSDTTVRFTAIKTDEDLRIQRRILSASGGYSIEIARAKHASFIDVPSLRRWSWVATRHPSRLVGAVVEHYCGVFFASELKDPMRRPIDTSPIFGREVRITAWPEDKSASRSSETRDQALSQAVH